MADLVRINDEVITTDGLIKHLKLNGQYDTIIEDLVREKLTAQAARKSGVDVSPTEVQERADQIRRVRGLHRAVDMNRWLDQIGVTVEDLEDFITHMLYVERMQDAIASDDAVESYFSLNSPKFDSIVLGHIVVTSEGKVREIMALLEDEPELFEELAREHSTADTAAEGGYIGMVTRGSLVSEVEAKVFHAEPGEVLGPFGTPDGSSWEIFMIKQRRNAALDDDTRAEIRRVIKEEWLVARARENRIEVC
jgi:parvulin-like peptidyl-prolyl isomerase